MILQKITPSSLRNNCNFYIIDYLTTLLTAVKKKNVNKPIQPQNILKRLLHITNDGFVIKFRKFSR